MICSGCGCGVLAGAQFCPACGARMMAAQARYGVGFAPEQKTRVANNLQAVGIMWCLFGGYRFLRGLIAASALHGMAMAGMFGDIPPFMTHAFGAMVPFIALSVAVMSVLSVVTGLGLLARKPWARTLAIVMAILSLIKIPFGTALGIYTLWVLAPSAAGEEWDQLGPVRGV